MFDVNPKRENDFMFEHVITNLSIAKVDEVVSEVTTLVLMLIGFGHIDHWFFRPVASQANCMPFVLQGIFAGEVKSLSLIHI